MVTTKTVPPILLSTFYVQNSLRLNLTEQSPKVSSVISPILQKRKQRLEEVR